MRPGNHRFEDAAAHLGGVIGGMDVEIEMIDISRHPFEIRGTHNESRDVIVVYRAQ